MKRLAWTVFLAAVLCGCNGEEFDLAALTDFADLAGSDGLAGINARSPAGAPVPEFGEPVIVQVVSESSVDADVTILYVILDVEVRRTILNVSPFESTHLVGPDLAAILRIDGTYTTGAPIPSAVMILGTDFEADDVIVYVIPDPSDQCLDDPGKLSPGICGCGVADTDGDGDGTPDCVDLCPADPGKINPGVCGCGVSDADGDGDGMADCIDGCPGDRNKTSPGVCGCGVADVDSDGDGKMDCEEEEEEEPVPTPSGGGSGGGAPPDCNGNGKADAADIGNGTSQDCNINGVPDECDLTAGASLDENKTGVPDECEGALAWRGARLHDGVGDLAIALDRGAIGAGSGGRTVEHRNGGIQRIEIDFAYPVQLLDDATIEAVDTLLGTAYEASSAVLVSGDTVLEVRFDSGVLPDGACYRIDLAGAIEEAPGRALVGDTDCVVCSLVGDVDGNGLVDNEDIYPVEAHRGEPVTADNCIYDVNLDGVISNSDMIVIRARRGNQI